MVGIFFKSSQPENLRSYQGIFFQRDIKKWFYKIYQRSIKKYQELQKVFLAHCHHNYVFQLISHDVDYIRHKDDNVQKLTHKNECLIALASCGTFIELPLYSKRKRGIVNLYPLMFITVSH